jgi:beta-N-acetylhexosaminidase
MKLGLLFLLLAQTALPPQVDEILKGLSLEQKAGQLLIVGFGGTEMDSTIAEQLRSLHVGAVALYSRNIRDNRQLARLIRGVRRAMAGEVPPLVAIDQEGGNVVRIKREVMVLPGAMALGATRDPALAFLAGQAVGLDLKLLGVNTNLAPVLDINRNPANPVINVRAFGESPPLVNQLALPYILGQQQAGLITVAKHFPGHGDADSDSHFELARIDTSWEDIWRYHLQPFREAVHWGLDAVMLAHVEVPAIDPSGTPSSLSAAVIDGVLRRQLGFEGVVMTDDLEMHAIADRYGLGRAAVQAVLAGADMVMVIWTAEKKKQVFQALVEAVRSGVLPAERLDEAVRRIISLKLRRGVFKDDAAGERDGVLPNPWHRRISLTVARRSLTLVRNKNQTLPVCQSDGVVVAATSGVFRNLLKQWLSRADFYDLETVPSDSARRRALERLLQKAEGARLVIVTVQNAYQAWLVQNFLQRSRVPVAVVNFGSPYLLQHFPRVAAYLCTYSFLPEAQQAAAEAMAGRILVTGRLPVTLGADYPAGFGLDVLKRCRP